MGPRLVLVPENIDERDASGRWFSAWWFASRSAAQTTDLDGSVPIVPAAPGSSLIDAGDDNVSSVWESPHARLWQLGWWWWSSLSARSPQAELLSWMSAAQWPQSGLEWCVAGVLVLLVREVAVRFATHRTLQLYGVHASRA